MNLWGFGASPVRSVHNHFERLPLLQLFDKMVLTEEDVAHKTQAEALHEPLFY